MPPPVSVNISHDARIIAGSSFNLTCNPVLLNEKIDISVSVIAKWDGPNGTLFNQIMTDHEMMLGIAKVNAARNGTYTCQATFNPNPDSEFITSSNSVTGSAIISVGKYCYVGIIHPPTNTIFFVLQILFLLQLM